MLDLNYSQIAGLENLALGVMLLAWTAFLGNLAPTRFFRYLWPLATLSLAVDRIYIGVARLVDPSRSLLGYLLGVVEVRAVAVALVFVATVTTTAYFIRGGERVADERLKKMDASDRRGSEADDRRDQADRKREAADEKREEQDRRRDG